MKRLRWFFRHHTKRHYSLNADGFQEARDLQWVLRCCNVSTTIELCESCGKGMILLPR
jgi:rRNA maturation endonuclease Nob1